MVGEAYWFILVTGEEESCFIVSRGEGKREEGDAGRMHSLEYFRHYRPLSMFLLRTVRFENHWQGHN